MAIGLPTKPLVFRPTHSLDVLWGHPLAQGLVGGWMFQEGAGRRVANIIPDALPGTFVANDSVTYPAWTLFHRPQYGGRAIQNQTQSYISVGDYTLLNPPRITVHAWFYRTSTTANEPGVTKRHLGNNSNNFFLGTGSSPNGMFSFIAYTIASPLTAESSTNFTTNAWHQVVGTYDGTNARLWVDRLNTATVAGGGALNGNTFPKLVIGSDFQVNGYWNGRIAFVVIWNRALSSAEITELYTNPHAFLAPPSTRRYFLTSIGQAFAQLLTESVTLTDALRKRPGKAMNDSVILTDTVNRLAAKGLVEAVTLNDVLAKLTAKAALTEGITLSETLIRGATKSLSESITLSDALARLTSKAFSDGVSLSDVLAKLTGRTLTDSVALTDTLVKQLIFTKLLTETISLTEALAKQTGKTLPETVTLTDSITKLLQRVLGEAVILSEGLVKYSQKLLAESVPLSDTALKQAQKTLMETATLTDSMQKDVTKLLSDSVVLSDAVDKRTAKILSELLTPTDTLVKTVQKVFAEDVILTDTLITQLVTVIRGYVQAVNKAVTELGGTAKQSNSAGGSGGGLTQPTGSSGSAQP